MLEKIGKYLFYLFCAAILVGGYCYIHFSFLTGIRLLALASILYYLCTPSKTKSSLYYGTLLFYTFYVIYTTGITFFYPYELTQTVLFNFLFIPIFLFALMGPVCNQPKQYLQYFYNFCFAALIVFSAVGAVEYIADIHVPGSALRLHTAEFSGKHSLSLFFHNPNDFGVIATLMLLYFLSYRKIFIPARKYIIGIVLTLLSVVLVYLTGCRTALVIIVFYLLFYFRQFIWRHRILFFIGIGIALSAGAIIFTIDESVLTRTHLYQYVFRAVFDSYGLGMGICGDNYFYSQMNNYDLFMKIINAHSYLFQMLITSGIFCFIGYLVIIYRIERTIACAERNEFWIMPILYLLLLFAPSSSLFLWPQYLFFAMYVGYAEYLHSNKKLLTHHITE